MFCVWGAGRCAPTWGRPRRGRTHPTRCRGPAISARRPGRRDPGDGCDTEELGGARSGGSPPGPRHLFPLLPPLPGRPAFVLPLCSPPRTRDPRGDTLCSQVRAGGPERVWRLSGYPGAYGFAGGAFLDPGRSASCEGAVTWPIFKMSFSLLCSDWVIAHMKRHPTLFLKKQKNNSSRTVSIAMDFKNSVMKTNFDTVMLSGRWEMFVDPFSFTTGSWENVCSKSREDVFMNEEQCDT